MQIEVKRSSCPQEFPKLENSTTFNKYIFNSQTTILSKIKPPKCNLSPLLILEMENLDIDEKGRDKRITLLHHGRILNFDLIGYTLLSGNHFTLKPNSILYYYDGMRTPKIHLAKSSRLPEISIVNFVVSS